MNGVQSGDITAQRLHDEGCHFIADMALISIQLLIIDVCRLVDDMTRVDLPINDLEVSVLILISGLSWWAQRERGGDAYMAGNGKDPCLGDKIGRHDEMGLCTFVANDV